MVNPSRIAFVVLALPAVWLVATACAQEASLDQRFLDGLLERRLFGLAESYCSDELRKSNISERRRVELTVALSRTYAEKALHAAPAQRQEHWQSAQDTIRRFRETKPAVTYEFLARRQAALVSLARGELARHEGEVVADSQRVFETARSDLRAAINELRSLEKDVSAELLRRDQTRDEPENGLGESELRILRNDVQFQLPKALMNQALCYALDSPDRINSLTRAAEGFKQLADIEEPVDWQSRFSLLACLRHLRDAKTWQQLLKQYVTVAPTVVEPQLKLETARYALAAGHTKPALDILEKPQRDMTVGAAAQWDFTRLQAALAAWREAKDEDTANKWRQRSAELADRLESEHGPYWMRRAEGLMGRLVAATPTTGDLAILSRAASAFYRAGKWKDALAAYDRAAAKADETGQSQQAFDLGFTAAAIQQEQGNHGEARDRFARLAGKFSENSKAPKAHLLAAFNAAELLRIDPTAGIDQYTTLLKEHLQRFSSSPSSDQAAWWLARVFMAQKKWPEAVRTLTGIGAEFPQFAAVNAAAADGYQQWLTQLRAANQDSRAVAEQATQYFAKSAAEATDEIVTRNAALRSIRFQIHNAHRDYGAAEQQLKKLLADSSAPDTWRTEARTLLLYALAAQSGRMEDAESVLAELEAAEPTDLLDLVDSLTRFADESQNDRRLRLAELQLRVADLIGGNRDKLSESNAIRLDMATARALVAAGRRDEAREAYGRLVKRFPNNGRIQTTYAELLLDGRDQQSWQAALAKWREIEKRSPRGSERWFRAKYSQALAHHRLGNSKQALRIIQLTEVLHPELGGEALKRQFLDLRGQCEVPTP